MSNLSKIRRLDAVYMYLRSVESVMGISCLYDTIQVLLTVREELAEGPGLKGVLSSREDVLAELDRMADMPPASEVADEILKDLRRGGEL